MLRFESTRDRITNVKATQTQKNENDSPTSGISPYLHVMLCTLLKLGSWVIGTWINRADNGSAGASV
jgi:hypothetical protein